MIKTCTEIVASEAVTFILEYYVTIVRDTEHYENMLAVRTLFCFVVVRCWSGAPFINPD